MQFVWAIALLIISYAITALTTPHPKDNGPSPANLADFTLPVPSEGAPQGVIFGDCWTQDWQVLWYGNLHNQEIHAAGSGKK